jgi:hypothetical protein
VAAELQVAELQGAELGQERLLITTGKEGEDTGQTYDCLCNWDEAVL